LLTGACPGLAVQSLLAFARAHLAVGDPAGARTLLTQASQVIHSHPDLGVLPDEVADLRATISALPVGLDGASSLTAAEVRVLGLLPYYLSFKEIAQRLGVKATTVKTHALAIYGKLGASTRGEAVAIASEAGLLERFPT
jgi:LuxR family maltose regulon positive regulatory protein